MRIITVNLPISYIKAIATLTGTDALYPSRSELIRVAVRDFLLSELEAAKQFQALQARKTHILPTPQERGTVRVPLGDGEYKTYTLVKNNPN